MNWLFYALIGPAFMAINNLVDKHVLDKHVRDIGAFTLIYALFSAATSFLLFLIIGFLPLPPISLFLILSAGMIQMVVFLSYFKALTLDEASKISPLFQTIPIFSLILGALFLGEFLKNTQIVGFFLIFVGGFLLSVKKFEITALKPRSAFWLMLMASLGSASIGVIFKFVAHLNSFWQTLAWENFGIGIAGFVLFFIPIYRKQFLATIKILNKKVYFFILLNEIAFFVARYGLRVAFTLAPVALVSVILGVQPLFLLLYAVLLTLFAPHILKEDIRPRTIAYKLVLMSLILLGIFIINL